MVHPPEQALPSGEWPLDAQVQIPGLETVAIVESAEDDEEAA
jgi:hypothetical protein